MSDTGLDFVALEAATAATQQAPQRTSRPLVRPATVLEVSSDRSLAEILVDQDDESVAETTGADIVLPTYLVPGDRVMVMFVPPRGAMVIGRLQGNYEPWSELGEAEAPFMSGWGFANGYAYPDQNGFAIPAYKRIGEMVHLKGRVQRTSGGLLTMFRLPGQYCPRNVTVLTTVVGPIGVAGTIVVRLDGDVELINGEPDLADGGFVSLDGVSFSID